MRRLFKYNFPVEGFGVIACVLLMLSRHLGALGANGIQALNHVLVVVILCLCVHFIRRTAALTHIHVWNDKLLSFLWLLPVFNLVITALQLMLGAHPVFSSPVFITVSVLFSLPTFFCLFFVYAVKSLCREKALKFCCIVLWSFGGAYTVLRLMDRVLFPVLLSTGKTLSETVLKMAASSSALSMGIYALAIACFCVLLGLRGKTSKQGK